MRSLNSVTFFLITAFITAFLCLPMSAQTVGTAILGTVADSSGAVIPGATVTVTNTATGIAKNVVSAASGEYSVTYLLPGTYDITVTASGFGTYEQKGVSIDLDQQARVNIALKVGTASETVSVQSSSQPLLQTEDASIGVVVGTENAENLPLNGRKFEDLAVLVPGVTVSDPDNHTSTAGGATIQAYGSQTIWGTVNLDGTQMNSNRHAYVNFYPSVDAISEFKVYTGNAEAQYGGGAGTVTNISIRSGTNNLHGDVFDFFRNQDLDARSWALRAPLPKQVLKQNQFGGVGGGPIIKDRTFFFVSYEGIRSLEQGTGNTSVLSPAERLGNFSELLAATPPNGQAQEKLVSPCTGVVYPGNILPTTNTTNTGCQDKFDPVAANIVNTWMPLPNESTSSGNYAYITTDNETVNQFIVRLDHKVNNANQLFLHYAFGSRTYPTTQEDPKLFTHSVYPSYNAAFQYLHTFSPQLLNELRAGALLERNKETGTWYDTSNSAASLGINGFTINGASLPPDLEGFPTITMSDYITMSDSKVRDDSRTYMLVDQVTWTKGKQILIFGADIRHAQDNADTSNSPFGSLSFTGTETAYNQSKVSHETGNAAADFMIGAPASITTPEGLPITMSRQWRNALYLQDDWKVTPKLTLNLGIRWDDNVTPHDDYHQSETFNWNTISTIGYPTLIPLPTPLWTITHKDFGPRVGFAYSLPWNSVIRSAYGITYYPGDFDNLNILQLNAPFDPSFTLANGTCGYCTTAHAPTSTLENPVSASITPSAPNAAAEGNNGNGIIDHHPDLYLQTWNLTLSKQFRSNEIDVAYVGVKGTHQDTSIANFNSGPPNNAATSGLTVNQDAVFPHYGTLRIVDYHGASMYSGLNTHFHHRVTNGLDLTVTYAWSHLLDNQGGDTNLGRNSTQNPNVKEWASGLLDQRNLLNIALTWNLPQLTSADAMVRHIVNGWRVGSIFAYQSGVPLYVTQSADGENNGSVWERPDFDYTQNRHIANRTRNQWFNTGAFSEAIGHYGSTTRDFITGPATDPVTFSVARTFGMPYNEKQQMEFRVEAYNAFNTPQWAAPNVTQGNSSFGKITNTTGNARIVQLAMKYYF